jgi:hypothetical protein
MSDVVQWIRGESQVREALKERINEEHRRCEETVGAALEHAIRAGEGLVQMKERVSHGEWRAWLREHFEGSERTAQAYMRLYQRRAEIRNGAADLSIRGALSSLSTPKPQSEPQPGEPTAREDEYPQQLITKLRDAGFSPQFAKWMAQAASRPEGLPEPETSEPTVREVLEPEDMADIPSGEFDRAEEKASLTSKIVPRTTDDPADVAEAAYRLYGENIERHIRWADDIANWYAKYRDELVARKKRGLRAVK